MTRNVIPLRVNPFKVSYVNEPAKSGMIADTKRVFGPDGEDSRYAVAPVHSRIGQDVVWFVWDAEQQDELGFAKVIRQEDSFEAAVAGLI
jgi:hypothetical protein